MEQSEEEQINQMAKKWKITIECTKEGHEDFICLVCLDYNCTN